MSANVSQTGYFSMQVNKSAYYTSHVLQTYNYMFRLLCKLHMCGVYFKMGYRKNCLLRKKLILKIK